MSDFKIVMLGVTDVKQRSRSIGAHNRNYACCLAEDFYDPSAETILPYLQTAIKVSVLLGYFLPM